MEKEILVSNLQSVFEPSDAINTVGDTSHWRSISYRSGEVCGTMLSALNDCFPEDVCYDPGLSGWYQVYVCLPTLADMEVWLRMTGDTGVYRLKTMRAQQLSITKLEEFLWRCCDMTGKKIILSRKGMNATKVRHSMLAWIRFIPMDETAVNEYLSQIARKDTKRIYATDDIHNRLFRDNIDEYNCWDSVILPYEGSDVEWLSLEDIACFTGGRIPTNTPDLHAFKRSGDKNVQKQLHKFNSVDVLTDLVQKGRKSGLSMSVSLRMGAWTMGFPWDQTYFDNPFFFENASLRCVDRDGSTIPSLSYAYREVQQYMIDRLVTLAGTGCDAVTLIAHRGGPYILFEEPLVAKFVGKYGELPHTRPLDDPELMEVRCGIMTEFFEKLRKALNDSYPERHVQIHLRALASVYDTKYFGIDCEELAKRGLVDAIISYPQRFREKISDVFFHNGRINLEKYRDYFHNSNEDTYLHVNDTDLVSTSVPDSSGILRTPHNLQQCVYEWMALEHNYGVKVYMEIMPRIMDPDKLRQRARELYASGAERIGLWDTYDRVSYGGMWAVAGKLGHKDELNCMQPPFYREYRIHELAGMDISRNHPSWGG